MRNSSKLYNDTVKDKDDTETLIYIYCNEKDTRLCFFKNNLKFIYIVAKKEVSYTC